jgi:hypothetical protein
MAAITDALPVATAVVGCDCPRCGHVWIGAYLPMDMRDMGRLMKRVCCPKCAHAKPLVAKTEKLIALGLARP